MPLAVLFRDSALAVLDKPAGLAVDEDVVPLAARELAPPGGRAWPRVVHRLDRGTSGCLVLALTQAAAQGLARALDQGQWEKAYLAVVRGNPPDSGALDTAYGPDPRDRRRFTTRIETPRRARLRYEVIQRLAGACLLRVQLGTGRTHQIRVQLSEAGFPLLGDEVYGTAHPGIQRPALHAERLSFPHPAGSRRVECTAAVPEDFSRLLSDLGCKCAP
ncbi:MAG TPA: RluA family pseudouridine synthase [Myxococcales bacterium]